MANRKSAKRIFILILMTMILNGCDTHSMSSLHPADVYMAKHITSAHGVVIGSDKYADIIVGCNGDTVTVVLSDNFYSLSMEDPLLALSIPDKSFGLSKEEYIAFLNKLHAYLMIKPLKLKRF